MPVRFLNQVPQFLTPDGKVLANGNVYFYQTGTNTPKNTYSDPELTTPNANPVELNAAGQPETDIWLDGVYRVILESSGAEQRWVRDNVPAPLDESGITIPALVESQFLTNNGTSLLWSAIREVPDPSGSPDYILSTDGENIIWIPQPEIPAPPTPAIQVTASSFRSGVSGSDFFFLQTGSGTASATGTNTTTSNVTFSTAFKALWYVGVMANSRSSTAAPAPIISNVTSSSTTGFTVVFDPAEGGSNSGNIINSIPFTWFAIGTVADPT